MPDRLSVMLDSLIFAVDEGHSFDGIVSVPGMGLEDYGRRPGLVGRLDDGVELSRSMWASVSRRLSRAPEHSGEPADAEDGGSQEKDPRQRFSVIGERLPRRRDEVVPERLPRRRSALVGERLPRQKGEGGLSRRISQLVSNGLLRMRSGRRSGENAPVAGDDAASLHSNVNMLASGDSADTSNRLSNTELQENLPRKKG